MARRPNSRPKQNRYGREGPEYRAAVARIKKDGSHICALCNKPIDMTLHHYDKWSWTMEHPTPLSRGGDPLDPANQREAHRTCNSKKGAKMGVKFNQSRVW